MAGSHSTASSRLEAAQEVSPPVSCSQQGKCCICTGWLSTLYSRASRHSTDRLQPPEVTSSCLMIILLLSLSCFWLETPQFGFMTMNSCCLAADFSKEPGSILLETPSYVLKSCCQVSPKSSLLQLGKSRVLHLSSYMMQDSGNAPLSAQSTLHPKTDLAA